MADASRESATTPPQARVCCTPPSGPIALRDSLLCSLWYPKQSVALAASLQLFAPCARSEAGESAMRAEEASIPIAERLAAELRRHLLTGAPRMPAEAEERYDRAVEALRCVLRHLHETPRAPFVEDQIEVALRAACRLEAGTLASEICSELCDLRRGYWTPHLTSFQRRCLGATLINALMALPPDALDVFWELLQSENAVIRSAMLPVLERFTASHAIGHLLTGLRRSRAHPLRMTIVELLEQIAEPDSIPVLREVQRQSAYTDWPLSRRIARALHVIERQNRHTQQRTLLRASDMPLQTDTLLRTSGGAETHLAKSPEERLLLRSLPEAGTTDDCDSPD